MIIANVRSHADLAKKKQLQQDLLSVEVNNEAELEKRVKDYKNPYTPKPVPPKHKTRAELMREVMELSKSLIDKFRNIDVPYEVAVGVLSEYNNDPDALIQLNGLFPSIKRKLLESSIPSLLTSEQIIDITNRILRQSELAFGFVLDRPSFKDSTELAESFDLVDALKQLKQTIVRKGVGTLNANKYGQAIEQINYILNIYPEDNFFIKLQSPEITPELRYRYLGDLERAFAKSGIPVADTVWDLDTELQTQPNPNQTLTKIIRILGGATDKTTALLRKTVAELEREVDEAPNRYEEKTRKRNIEQFGPAGADAIARAEGGETGDVEEEDELVNERADIEQHTDGANPTHQTQAEVRAEQGRVDNLALKVSGLTKNQLIFFDFHRRILDEQLGIDNNRESIYRAFERYATDLRELAERLKLSPDEVEQVADKVRGLIESVAGETVRAEYTDDKSQSLPNPNQSAPYEEETKEGERKVATIDPFYHLERDRVQSSLANLAQGQKYKQVGKQIKGEADNQFTRDITQYSLAETAQKAKDALPRKKYIAQPALAEIGQRAKELQISNRDRSQLPSSLGDLRALSLLAPEAKFISDVEEAKVNGDDERQRKLAEIYQSLAQPQRQRIDAGMEAREDAEDYATQFVARNKDPAITNVQAKQIVDELTDELFAEAVRGELSDDALRKTLAQLKEPKPATATPATSAFIAKKLGRIPVEAVAEPEPKKKTKKQLKAEADEERRAEQYGVKLQEATNYFRQEFIPQFAEVPEPQQRALLRNMVIKIRDDYGNRYDDIIPLPSLFDRKLSPENEAKTIDGLEQVFLDKQISNNFAPNTSKNIRGQYVRGNPDSEKTTGLKKGIGVKAKRKPKRSQKEESDSESSSDDEMTKPIVQQKAFKSSRIKVGKGIEVVEEPRYKTFGKYVIHMPQLHNNNLNFKYPKSLGTVPHLRPTQVSGEYRDFIIDVMDSGKMNEKDLRRLAEHEQKHFEKVVVGCGLIETLKLKTTTGKDEKTEADRFNLLRGEYLAGNNAPTLIKELRGFVLKFMDDGRIKRKDGMSLLAELAVSL